MKRTRLLLFCVNLTGVLALATAAYAGGGADSAESAPVVQGEANADMAGVVEFRYAPPDGTQIQESISRIVGSDYGKRGTRIDVFTASNTQKIVSKPNGNYEVRMTIDSIRSLHNGKPMNNPVVDAMKDAKLVYFVEPPGRATRIEGMNKIADVLRAHFPKKKMTPEIEKTLAGADMEEKELADWNARYAAWNHQYFLPGKSYYGIGTYTLEPGLYIRYGITAKVVGGVSCYEGDSRKNCAKIRFDYSSNDDLIEKGRMASIREAAEFLKKGDVLGGTLEGHLDRVVDPKTLLIYSEKQKKTILFPLSVNEGEEIRVRRIEQTEFSYRYDSMPPGVPRVASSPN